MPCVVCLEDFTDAENDTSSIQAGKRAPHALPCGHIFHGECIQQWFTQCRANAGGRTGGLSCPQCKTTATNEKVAIRLFPGDAYDLDAHLQRYSASMNEEGSSPLSKNRYASQLLSDASDELANVIPGLLFQGGAVQRVRASAIEGNVKKEVLDDDEEDKQDEARLEQGKLPADNDAALLSSLLDFTRSLQAYVIAVHGLRLQTVRKAKQRVWQFVDEHIPAGEQHDNLQTVFQSLNIAMEQFEEARSMMQARTFAKEAEEKKYQKKLRKVQATADSFAGKEQQIAMQKEEANKTTKELQKWEQRLFTQSQALDKLKDEVAATEVQCRSEVREARIAASMARMEAKEEVKKMELATERKLHAMQTQVTEYERRAHEAEKLGEASRQKSLSMAAQMRTNEKKLNKLRDRNREQAEEIDRLRMLIAQGNTYVNDREEKQLSEKARGKKRRVDDDDSLAADSSRNNHETQPFFQHRSAVGDVSYDTSRTNVSSSSASKRGSSRLLPSSPPPPAGQGNSSAKRYASSASSGRHYHRSGAGEESLIIEGPDLSEEMEMFSYALPGGVRAGHKQPEQQQPAAATPLPFPMTSSSPDARPRVHVRKAKGTDVNALARSGTAQERQPLSPVPQTPSRSRNASNRDTSLSPSKKAADRVWASPYASRNELSPRKKKAPFRKTESAGATTAAAKQQQTTLDFFSKNRASAQETTAGKSDREQAKPLALRTFQKHSSTGSMSKKASEDVGTRRLALAAISGLAVTAKSTV